MTLWLSSRFSYFWKYLHSSVRKMCNKKKKATRRASALVTLQELYFIYAFLNWTQSPLCGRSPWRKVCDWIRQRVPPFVIVCRRRQQRSSCEAHSPSVWLRALRTASTWLPGPSPARWAARPPARPGKTTMMGVHHSFGPATQREHGRLAEEARGTWKRLEDMFRHPEKEGTPSGVAVSCRCYAGFGAPAMTCFYHQPPSRNRLQNVGSVMFFLYAHLKTMFIILTLK